MNRKELGKNQSLARELNNKIVINKLKEKPFSGTELSKELSLSNATLSSIFNSFLSINLIKKVSSDTKSGVGRKLVKYAINDEFGLVIIVSITGNSLEVVASSLNNETLYKVTKDIEKYDLKTIYETIVVIKDILILKEFRDIPLRNIILSLPGLIDKKTGELQVSPQFDQEIFKNKNSLLQLFEENFKCPVYLENDSKLMTLGEIATQVFKERKNAAVIYIDKGVGSGIVIGNKLFYGSRGFAGEIGLIDLNGKPLDEYISLRSLSLKAKEILNRPINNAELIELYKNNIEIKKLVLESAKYLAFGLKQLINVLDLDYFILNGRVKEFGKEYIDIVNNEIKKSNDNAITVYSVLDENPIIVGAKEIGSDYVLTMALKELENYEK